MAKVQVTIEVENGQTLGEALRAAADAEVSPKVLAEMVRELILRDPTDDPWNALARAFGYAIHEINKRAGHAFVPSRVTFTFERDSEPTWRVERILHGIGSSVPSPSVAARG